MARPKKGFHGMKVTSEVPVDRVERRASERIPLGLACKYVIPDVTGKGRAPVHKGVGKVLNMSRGGMLLRLETQPLLEQLIQVHLSHPNTGKTLSEVQVLWTAQTEDRREYLAGCRFVSGPYSPTQDRLCAPADFVSS